MPSDFTSYTITWYDQTDAYSTTTDITGDVKAGSLFTDTGTGEVNTANILIDSANGLYNTTGSTIFAEFDRIRIQCTDLGSNSYDRYFEIINILPSQDLQEGTMLTLECLGIEHHTQKIHMTKPYYFENSFLTAVSAGDLYNRSRGTEQPTLSFHNIIDEGNGFGNALPFFNANNWEFGIAEDTIYNRWMDLIEGVGAAVGTGGALTFFELNFLTTGVNAISFNLRRSGDNSTIIQLQNSVASAVAVGEQEGMISNPTGTNVMAWGSNEHGTLPVGNSKYDSGLMKFIFRPEWISGTLYETDARIKVTGTGTPAPKHYKALEDHTSGTFSTDLAANKWVQVDMGDEFGDTIQYSPWTDGNARLWSNAGADPARANFTNGGWFDINIVINEQDFFRSWVDAIAVSDANLTTLAATYAYDGTSATFPRGFRVLVNNDSPSGALSNFANMVVERMPTNSLGGTKWAKLYNFDVANTKVQIANLDNAQLYVDTITAGPSHSWTNIDASEYGNDCFHPYTTAPANSAGIDLVHDPAGGDYRPRSKITDTTERPDIIKSGSSDFALNVDSAVKFITLAPDAITSAAVAATGKSDPWYLTTIGFNWRVPFPNNDSGTAQVIGGKYGGGASLGDWTTSTIYSVGQTVHESSLLYICIIGHTSGTFATDLAALKWRRLVGKEPATLDIQNMNYLSDGQDTFNALSDSSEDYGQISAVAFWLRYSIIESAGSTELNDEHRFRAWFCDTKDNVVYQDFVVRFSNNWEDIRLPVSGFRIYKGRKPLYGFDVPISAFVPPKELEIINIFEWRNIKLMGVQYQSQYDEFGRFNPGAAIVNESGNSVTWSNILGATRTLEMDGFRFIKPLLATSGNVSDRNLEPNFQQWPNITVYDQLKNVAKSHLEIERFKHKEFTVESSGDEIFDILFGDAFFLKNSDIVNDDDKDGEDNNIKLVAKRIEYSITKSTGGRGGIRRSIQGSRVFT